MKYFIAGYGLKCWECTGSENDCSKDTLADHKDEKLKTCDDSMNTCMRTSAEADGETGVVSLCNTKEICDVAKKACEDSGECEVGCCTTDECNASSALSSSVILLAACSVFGLGLLK